MANVGSTSTSIEREATARGTRVARRLVASALIQLWSPRRRRASGCGGAAPAVNRAVHLDASVFRHARSAKCASTSLRANVHEVPEVFLGGSAPTRSESRGNSFAVVVGPGPDTPVCNSAAIAARGNRRAGCETPRMRQARPRKAGQRSSRPKQAGAPAKDKAPVAPTRRRLRWAERAARHERGPASPRTAFEAASANLARVPARRGCRRTCGRPTEIEAPAPPRRRSDRPPAGRAPRSRAGTVSTRRW